MITGHATSFVIYSLQNWHWQVGEKISESVEHRVISMLCCGHFDHRIATLFEVISAVNINCMWRDQRLRSGLHKSLYWTGNQYLCCLAFLLQLAYYTAKLTFSHDFLIQIWVAYYTSVRIIFEFLRYVMSGCDNWASKPQLIWFC